MNTAAILYWFTGKAKTNAETALDLLTRSAEQGFWIPGASRKVRAALSKSNVARKIGRATRFDFDFDYRNPAMRAAGAAASNVTYVLSYGAARTNIDFAALRAQPLTDVQLAAVDAAERLVAAFAPAWALMAQLDATRPKPVFTHLGVSPTLTATLAQLNASLDPGSLGMPETEFVRVESVDEKGKKVYGFEIIIHWPEGTVHQSSVHAYKRACCHACGHRIKNPFNWVPLYAKDKADVPHSMWVGRDCAESLFGIKLTGDLVLKGGVEAAMGVPTPTT